MTFKPAEGDLQLISNRRWRLDNLYYVLDENGDRRKFRMRWAQEELLNNIHNKNIILKARQMGFSTFIDLMILDACLFNSNTSAAIVDKTLDDARGKLKDKIIYAYDNLPDEFKKAVPMSTRNSDKVEFKNGSSIKIGTSVRGGTIQWLHVSELGAIAARAPRKAKEIKSGAFNAVSSSQTIFVESTAEGKEGVFYDLCADSMGDDNEPNPMRFKFHFYPWWMDGKYQSSDVVVIPVKLQEYFVKLKAEGINLTDRQKWWYVSKAAEQKDDMKREFPSFAEEAFEASMEGAYFSQYMADALEQGRINHFPYNPAYPVNTFWDIGRRDNTAIWFVQFINGWIYLVDHYEMSGKQIRHYADLVHSKPYKYGQHWFPHDIRAETWGMESTRIEQLVAAGIEPDIVPNLSNADQIESGYDVLPRCRFNREMTEHGRKCLRHFRKEWDDDRGTWGKDYYHDWSSDTAKAFLYMAVVYKQEDVKIEKSTAPLTVPSLALHTYDELAIEKNGAWRNRRI